jgi:hypothetical protein
VERLKHKKASPYFAVKIVNIAMIYKCNNPGSTDIRRPAPKKRRLFPALIELDPRAKRRGEGSMT